jgi:hypothetical protein
VRAVQVKSARLWLVFRGQDDVPDEVVHEISTSALLEVEDGVDSVPTRGLSDTIALLASFALSGVIGNAAWSAFPLTAAYVRNLRRSHDGDPPVSAEDAAALARDAADEIVGVGAPIKTQSVVQLSDGTWELELDIGGDLVLVQISAKGTVIAFRTIGPHRARPGK